MAKKKEETQEEEVAVQKTYTAEQTSDLIKEAIRQFQTQQSSPVQPERSDKHTYNVHRFLDLNVADAPLKWVVGFVDRNKDPLTQGQEVHSFSRWNSDRKEMEAFVELKFHDGTTLEVLLTRYIQHRKSVEMEAESEREEKFSVTRGSVEKREVGANGRIGGTGVHIPQSVTYLNKFYKFSLPIEDGKKMEVELPGYILA